MTELLTRLDSLDRAAEEARIALGRAEYAQENLRERLQELKAKMQKEGVLPSELDATIVQVEHDLEDVLNELEGVLHGT